MFCYAENAFFYNGAHRYVFEGAEVYYDPDDVEEDDDTASNSSGASDLEDVEGPDSAPAADATTPATEVNSVPSTIGQCPIVPANCPSTAESFDDIVKAVAAIEEAAVRLGAGKPIGVSCVDKEQPLASETSYGANSSCATLRGDSGRSQSCESTDSGTTNTSSSSCSSSNSDDSQQQSRLHRHNSSSVPSDVDALLSSSEQEDHDEVHDWMSLHASLDAQSFDDNTKPHTACVDAADQQGIMSAEKSSNSASVML